jgi:cell division protein FtsB
MKMKTIGYSLFLSIELLLFIYMYVSGVHGLKAVRGLQQEYRDIEKSCTQLKTECATLRSKLKDWAAYPAYREIHARKHMHLAAPEEEWYRYEEK